MSERNVEGFTGCTEVCWTAVPCPDHGEDMYPRGRDAGMYAHYCCDKYQDWDVNPRHLWHEHDSTRWYTDPEGWSEHEQACEQCRPTEGANDE